MSGLKESERLELEELRARKAERNAKDDLDKRRETAGGFVHFRSGADASWKKINTSDVTTAILDLDLKNIEFDELLLPSGEVISPYADSNFDAKNITRESLGRAILEASE